MLVSRLKTILSDSYIRNYESDQTATSVTGTKILKHSHAFLIKIGRKEEFPK